MKLLALYLSSSRRTVKGLRARPGHGEVACATQRLEDYEQREQGHPTHRQKPDHVDGREKGEGYANSKPFQQPDGEENLH